MFVGKDTDKKGAAVSQAVMQAVRQMMILSAFQIAVVSNYINISIQNW